MRPHASSASLGSSARKVKPVPVAKTSLMSMDPFISVEPPSECIGSALDKKTEAEVDKFLMEEDDFEKMANDLKTVKQKNAIMR